ncbi:hypothetical protein F4805DRAFT_28284 [Annulohypoxylon moriforme]|nr:hypothetical protein F4805DRAFT_28284 [Annulohypoxylon moriforme]
MAPKSSPKKAEKAHKDVQLTQRDMEILSFAWQCFTVQPKIDFEKLAKVAPFKNSATARVCFGTVKKKFMGAGESSEASAPTTPRKKRMAGEMMTSSSSKKAKSAKSSRKVLPKVEEDDDDETPKKKIRADIEAEKDAELMSGFLGFDVKKQLETSEDDNESEA